MVFLQSKNTSGSISGHIPVLKAGASGPTIVEYYAHDMKNVKLI